MSGSGRKKMSVMARDGDEEGIARLLDEGVDPAAPEECLVSGRVVFDSVEMTVDVQRSQTALHMASWKGYMSLVRLLVERAPQLLEMGTVVRGLSLSLPVD
jgi:hypothetical protein